MKITWRFFTLILILVFIAAGCGANEGNTEASSGNNNSNEGTEVPNNGNDEVFVMTAGHTLTQDHFLHKSYEVFEEYVEKESDGRIEVDIFTDSQLGDDRELIEGVQTNTVTMTVPSTAPVGGFVQEFSVFDLPFLFENREIAYEVLDGEIGSNLLEQLEDIGIKGLGYWENGYRNLTNNTQPVRTPEDLDGMVIRTMENPMHVSSWELLSANPTPMAWSDVFVSLQQGALDGQENPLATIYDQKIYEVQDYLTLTGHVYSPMPILISKDFYDELPDDLKTVVDEGAALSIEENRRLSVEEEGTYLELMEEEGMEIIELTPEETKRFQEATLPVYEEYKDDIGAELVEAILDAAQ